jgi:hypothetical protein
MRNTGGQSCFISTIAATVLVAGFVACQGGEAAPAGSAQDTLKVGAFKTLPPPAWRLLADAEERQVRAEIQQGTEQMMQSYQATTGREHPNFGIREFKAMRLSNQAGYCIIWSVTLPPQTDYYSSMASDTTQKLEWGLKQGVFEKIIESGTAKIGEETVLRTIVQRKGGGRMITLIYWSPKAPSDVTQIMILESNGDPSLRKQVDAFIASIMIDGPK